MAESGPSEQFIRQLTLAQHGLYAFITTLMADADAANDVMQETNIVLCRKWQEFDESRPFENWAAKIARYKVMEHLRAEHRRHQRVALRDDVLELVADEANQPALFDAAYTRSLNDCLDDLSPDAREMLAERYTDERSVKEIADARGRSPGSVAVSMCRVRQRLLECIQRKLRQEAVE